MSFLKFDEKQAGSGFEVLPVGEYECIITKAENKKSSAGNDMIGLTLTVRADANETGGNRKLFDNLVFTPKAMFKVHQLLKALGTPQDQEYATQEELRNALLYKYVRVKIKHEPDRNDPTTIRERVNYFMPSNVGGPELGSENDPFATEDQTINISDDDLPF